MLYMYHSKRLKIIYSIIQVQLKGKFVINMDELLRFEVVYVLV